MVLFVASFQPGNERDDEGLVFQRQILVWSGDQSNQLDGMFYPMDECHQVEELENTILVLW